MSMDNPKNKDVYIPLALIGLATVLMIVTVLFPGKGASDSVLKGLLLIVIKIGSLGLVIFLGMGLCGWFGYPFTPFGWSLLQLLAVVLFTGALRGILEILFGAAAATYISAVPFLGLMGYFFSDDAMNALIAISLLLAASCVVTYLLIPFLAAFIF
jgi:hypothetical protein